MSNDRALVDAWLQEHKPRRFDRGDSATPDALCEFLRARGYDLNFTGWKGGGRATLRHVGQRGRPPSMSMRDLLAFVDELRITEGLEPILKPDSDVARELEAWAA